MYITGHKPMRSSELEPFVVHLNYIGLYGENSFSQYKGMLPIVTVPSANVHKIDTPTLSPDMGGGNNWDI